MKLLVNAPTGDQEIIEVREGGGYFDASRVLWDERTDGPMPDVTPGGLVRSGNALVADPVLVAAHEKKIADAATNAVLLADILAAEDPTGFTRRQREFLLAYSTDTSLKARLQAIENTIAAKRAALNP